MVGALGFFGGFFIVPISAILQHRPAKEEKGVILAAANLLSSVRAVRGRGSVLAAGRGAAARARAACSASARS